MREQAYESEDVLQVLVEEYPQLLAGDAIDAIAPRRWLLVKREAGVPREEGGSSWWSADHLLLDQDGVPTIVEVKRSTDTRIRREVIGQMLDYAANAVAYWPIETLQGWFESTCVERKLDGSVLLAELRGDAGDPGAFWTQVKTNLEARRIRLLFVADAIPPELQRIVEFLNEQMVSTEVLAVEVRQFSGEGLRTLVPRVIGNTARADETKHAGSAARRFKWDQAKFFVALEENGIREAVTVAQRLLRWAKEESGGIEWGTGNARGSFLPRFTTGVGGFKPFSVWTSGEICIQFGYLDKTPPLDPLERREEFRRKLNEIPGVNIPESAVMKGWPAIPLALLATEEAFSRFIAAIHWAVDLARQD